MLRSTKKATDVIGLPPGTLVHVGEYRTEVVTMQLFDYTENDFVETLIDDVEQCFDYKEKDSITWININGIHDLSIIEKIGSYFNFHPLLLEDIVNTHQRPKIDDYDNHIFVILKMLYYNEEENKVIEEQVSLVLGKNYVISFQEIPGDVFESIRDRIRNGKGKIRKMSADYLLYCLLDAIVDHYYLILEHFNEEIAEMEDKLVSDPSPEFLHNIHWLKKTIISLGKSIWPLRTVISNLQRTDTDLIQHTSLIYFRDVYDHTIQVIDSIETYRDLLSAMLDVYLSSISFKMNGVMKVLTIISTIFIPLTFIAGVYGMNFKYMPELEWKAGYFLSLGIMLLVALGLLVFFKRKKWL